MAIRGVPRERRAISNAPPCSKRHPQDVRGALDDQDQVVGVVVVETGDEAEAVAQRAGDEAGARGGADEREPGKVEADGTRRGSLPDDDVELEVFHRRVEDLLDRPGQTVDLVDEQHVAVVEVGEDGGEVAGPLQRGPARDPQADVHLGGDDARQRGLPQPRWPGEEQMVDGLPATACRGQEDLEVLLEAGLADELVESAGSERDLLGLLHRIGRGPEQFFPHRRLTRSPPGA